MIRQIKYFQAVIRSNSFSEAAEECHISQSAISQQVQALERELGFQLLERKNRKFTLTPSGEYFYKKSLILIADYERICNEANRIAHEEEAALSVGYLRGYNGPALIGAMDAFAFKYPQVRVKTEPGDHEELFAQLRGGCVDLVFTDQRRAFSEEYVNIVLSHSRTFIAISARSPVAALESVTLEELKNTPCILVASETQQRVEEAYYRDVIGFQGEFWFAENLEEAKLLVISGSGFMLTNGENHREKIENSLCHVPLFRNDQPVSQTYCVFWKRDNTARYKEAFAEILKGQFDQ
ncbi:LysR family transcriptional regulator [Eubacterium sp. 1001713B170207_170306_E7]|uniref:LysR family transcriptional regulator n=1 Tax=Eubacterium sp. 1001713B170207_170306_E7 TaxID=2787097 RepID=UPI001897758E|nr:LysR family transcriptional regulator [Eubacterium sp. 1001713B170207_170306_E7]